MSIKVQTWVWEQDIAPNHKLVLLRLADHADDDGQTIFPSVALTASRTGYSERNVQYVLRELEKAGLLEVVAPATPRRPTEYRIPVPWVGRKDCTPGVQPRAPRGARSRAPGVQPTAPEPSENHHEPRHPGSIRLSGSGTIEPFEPPEPLSEDDRLEAKQALADLRREMHPDG